MLKGGLFPDRHLHIATWISSGPLRAQTRHESRFWANPQSAACHSGSGGHYRPLGIYALRSTSLKDHSKFLFKNENVISIFVKLKVAVVQCFDQVLA
jgi:hypothetical protein